MHIRQNKIFHSIYTKSNGEEWITEQEEDSWMESDEERIWKGITWKEFGELMSLELKKVGMKGDGKECLFKELFGEESELYARFKKWALYY